MKQGSTIFLRAAVIIVGLIVLTLCIFAFPEMSKGMVMEFPQVAHLKYFILVGYGAALPFLCALYQGWKILNYIDKNKAFSELSVKALRSIKYCAVLMSIALAAGMPFMFFIAQLDDAPGLILIWAAIVGIPIVVAVLVAVLQKLLKNAIVLKSENDLTV